MMPYSIFIDGAPEGPWMGHLLSEPGCIWLAPTRGDAVAQAPAAITAFYAWLRRHGEPVAAAPSDVPVEVAEVQEIPRFDQSGAAVGFFDPDRAPVTDADMATVVRRLGYARRDLLEAVTAVPPEALDWAPPGGKRTIRKNLIHIYNCQGFYLSRVLSMPGAEAVLPDPWPEETFACLNWVMDRATAALYDLPPALREGTYAAEQPAELWTARKMLRRFVEHEREHVLVVRRTLEAYRQRT